MNFKRTILTLMALLMMGVCFAACDTRGEKDTLPPDTQDTDEVPDTSSGSNTVSEESDTEDDGINHDPIGEILPYDSFSLDTYMSPIWDGRVVYNETVMFVGTDRQASLLYTPDEILSVRSYDLQTVYEEGRDYELADGKLVLLEGTRIPVISKEEYYSEVPIDGLPAQIMTKYRGKKYYTYWGEGTVMTKWQIAVTYVHSQRRQDFKPENSSEQFARLIAKLEKGEDVTVIFYGDSITCGANASGYVGVSPYSPSWSQLFTQAMASKYGYTVKYVNTGLAGVSTPPANDTVFGTNGTITFINTAVGGWTAANGSENFDTYIKPFVESYGCDFFALAFGMNDGNLRASAEKQAIKNIADKLYALAPNSDMLLVATMVPNPESVNGWYGNQFSFEAALQELAAEYIAEGKPCAVSCTTSLSRAILEVKRFRDITGNNINHPNDYMCRVYAQVAFETVIGYKK